MRRDRKNYMRPYQRIWIKKRRTDWIIKNGPCTLCGSEKDLQVDHINRRTKELNPQAIWSRQKSVRVKELSKCQVLCGKCHKNKTSRENKGEFRVYSFPQQRIVSNDKFLLVLSYIGQGLSERSACRLAGISRGTFSSTKSRGMRKEIFGSEGRG